MQKKELKKEILDKLNDFIVCCNEYGRFGGQCGTKIETTKRQIELMMYLSCKSLGNVDNLCISTKNTSISGLRCKLSYKKNVSNTQEAIDFFIKKASELGWDECFAEDEKPIFFSTNWKERITDAIRKSLRICAETENTLDYVLLCEMTTILDDFDAYKSRENRENNE